MVMYTHDLSINLTEVMLTLLGTRKTDTLNRELLQCLLNTESNPYATDPILHTDTSDITITKSNANSVIMKHLFPYPFDGTTTEEKVMIHVFFPFGTITNNQVVQDNDLIIDIIVPKKYWLINDGTNSLIRPYDMMKHIMEIFRHTTVGTMGELEFEDYQLNMINEKFSGLRLKVSSTTFSG